MSFLELNQKVLIKKDNCYKIVIINDKKVELDRVKFSLNGLIGCSYGSSFVIENGNLVKVMDKSKINEYEKRKVEELICDDEKTENIDINMKRDNRNMNLNTKNQLMTATEIDELKRNGESGDTILNKLIENSTSFAQKTTFAQEKYLSKKKKRYIPVISVHKITTRMLCELYGAKSKLRIMNLRIDTVSQILAYSNAHFGSRVLLSETCAGLILGSLIERGAQVINFYNGSAPVLPECYSEWKEVENCVYNLPLAQIVPLATCGGFVNHFVASERESGNPIEKCGNNSQETEEPRKKRIKLSTEAIQVKREERDRRREEAKNYLLSSPCDSLVIAIKFQSIINLTNRLLAFLAPGKPFVVYSQFLQPLVELYDSLRKTTNTCSLRITESWLRNYQVLPDRTHPEMSMSGTGGYLLTGIKLGSNSCDSS